MGHTEWGGPPRALALMGSSTPGAGPPERKAFSPVKPTGRGLQVLRPPCPSPGPGHAPYEPRGSPAPHLRLPQDPLHPGGSGPLSCSTCAADTAPGSPFPGQQTPFLWGAEQVPSGEGGLQPQPPSEQTLVLHRCRGRRGHKGPVLSPAGTLAAKLLEGIFGPDKKSLVRRPRAPTTPSCGRGHERSRAERRRGGSVSPLPRPDCLLPGETDPCATCWAACSLQPKSFHFVTTPQTSFLLPRLVPLLCRLRVRGMSATKTSLLRPASRPWRGPVRLPASSALLASATLSFRPPHPHQSSCSSGRPTGP